MEAARAGEQGRGFAVVAGEERHLAQRSASAAREIKAFTGDAVDRGEAGALLVDQAGATMSNIVASVQHVSGIIGEIAAGGEAQAAGLARINRAVKEMDAVTQQNAALVEEDAAVAQSMQEQADNLSRVIRVFKLAGGGAVVRPATPAKPGAALPAAARQEECEAL